MRCPKCEEGTIIKIRFKYNGKKAYLCDFCDSLWQEDEHIDFNTGHALRAYSEGRDLEYSFEELNEKDQDHQPANKSKENIII